jgi:hypothetical protein
MVTNLIGNDRIGFRILNPLGDPELKSLWDNYIRVCKSKSSSLGEVTRAFSSYESAWREKRDRALARYKREQGDLKNV